MFALRSGENTPAIREGYPVTSTANYGLLRHDTDHYRAAVDHTEFARCRATDIDDTSTAIWTAICYASDDPLAVASVCHQHFRTKRQRAMSGRELRWATYLPKAIILAEIRNERITFVQVNPISP
jgi:hypothetical protein